MDNERIETSIEETEIKDNVIFSSYRDTKKQITILRGEVKPFTQTGFHYQLNSIEAIEQLVKFRGNIQSTVIFYNDSHISVIVNDQINDRPKDTAIYKYPTADFYNDWKNQFGRSLTQKEFVDFLKNRPIDEVKDGAVYLGKIQCLSMETNITGNYQYDDNNNYTVAFTKKDGAGSSVKLPQVIQVALVLIEGSDLVMPIDVEVELVKPERDTDRPRFAIKCPKEKQYWKVACEHEVNRLKEKLPDWQIIFGNYERC